MCAYFFGFQRSCKDRISAHSRSRISIISKGRHCLGAPQDSNQLERGAALFLRSVVLLLAGYVVFHKIFPFDLLEMHLIEMTGADLLLLFLRSVFGTVAALYFLSKVFAQPPLRERDRLFCEHWAALGLGTILIIACSIIMRFVEGEQTIVRVAKLLARAVRWLLF